MDSGQIWRVTLDKERKKAPRSFHQGADSAIALQFASADLWGRYHLQPSPNTGGISAVSRYSDL
jgi:hypothetical protein